MSDGNQPSEEVRFSLTRAAAYPANDSAITLLEVIEALTCGFEQLRSAGGKVLNTVEAVAAGSQSRDDAEGLTAFDHDSTSKAIRAT
jgi:hypothetical protein